MYILKYIHKLLTCQFRKYQDLALLRPHNHNRRNNCDEYWYLDKSFLIFNRCFYTTPNRPKNNAKTECSRTGFPPARE